MTAKVTQFNELFDQSVEDYDAGKINFKMMALLWWNMNHDDHKSMRSDIFNPYFTKHSCSYCSSRPGPLVYYLEKMPLKEIFGTLYALCGIYRCAKCSKINWISNEQHVDQVLSDPKFDNITKNYQEVI